MKVLFIVPAMIFAVSLMWYQTIKILLQGGFDGSADVLIVAMTLIFTSNFLSRFGNKSEDDDNDKDQKPVGVTQ